MHLTPASPVYIKRFTRKVIILSGGVPQGNRVVGFLIESGRKTETAAHQPSCPESDTLGRNSPRDRNKNNVRGHRRRCATRPGILACDRRYRGEHQISGFQTRHRQHSARSQNRMIGTDTRRLSNYYFLISTAARYRSSDSTSAESATVSAISWRKSSR